MNEPADLAELLRRWEQSQGRTDHLEENSPTLSPALIPEMQQLLEPADESPTKPSDSQILMPAEGERRRVTQSPVPGFSLVRRLGQGGFGEVWEAEGPGGVPVALKLIRTDETDPGPELRALELMKNIRHPNLLAMFGVWQIPGLLILAMELADKTLLQRLKECQADGFAGIPTTEIREHFLEAAKGIDHLHSLGIQHRDIKPQNLLLVGSGVKVGDFGLATLMDRTVRTAHGNMTPAYSPPEYFNGRTHEHSDQYSLAISYCELRGARLPFIGTQAQIMIGHLHQPPDLSMLPAEEQPVVARALAKDPELRWPSCRAFVEALSTAAATEKTIPLLPAPAPPSPPRVAWLNAVLLLAMFALVGVLARPLLRQFQRAAPPAPTTSEERSAYAEKLVGVWVTFEQNDAMTVPITYAFTRDGKLTIRIGPGLDAEEAEGTYILSGEVLTLRLRDEKRLPLETTTIRELTDTRLVLETLEGIRVQFQRRQ